MPVLMPDRFGEPISMDEYKEQFFSGLEGAPRAAVKRLTRSIERELIEATINAPDWYSLLSIADCAEAHLF